MGFWSKKVETSAVTDEYEPFLIVDEQQVVLDKVKDTSVSFKGEVELKTVKFPAQLGEEHPFDFSTCEGLYKKYGIVTAIIDKYIDFVVGPGFFIECEDERAKEIIEQFMQDVNMDTLLRAWIKEALMKGNGFLEIGGKDGDAPKGLKVLDAKYMYVDRDEKGVIKKFNQYTGGFKRFDKTKMIPFETHQIAHIPFNKVGDAVYGLGIIIPVLNTINNLIQNEKDVHMLMSRKANSPYDVTMGKVVGGKYIKPKKAAIEEMAKKLEWLHNKHEWAHDGLTEIKTLNFGDIGEKFESVLKYDLEKLFSEFQIPEVLMGRPVNLATAPVQMDTFERRIVSIQAEVEKVIEKELFGRVLQANGFDVHVEFQWGRPSTMDKYNRLEKIKEFAKSPILSESLRRLMEKDIVKLLDYNEDDYEAALEEEDKMKEEERKREEERQQPIVPGQNARPPQRPPTQRPPQPKPVDKTKYQLPKDNYLVEIIRKIGNKWGIFSHRTGKRLGTYDSRADAVKALQRMKAFSKSSYGDVVCPHCQDIKESDYNDIKEWLGFNYREYLAEIKKAIKADKFEMLVAANGIEEVAGKFTHTQVIKLKEVLDEGFTKGQGIKEMSKAIDRKVNPKDLLKMEGGRIITKGGVNVVTKAGNQRAINIARTETTRMANEGAIKHFKEGGVKQIRWVASSGPRTCPECEDLNGQIFGINEHPDIPLHAMCRCTVVPITELG